MFFQFQNKAVRLITEKSKQIKGNLGIVVSLMTSDPVDFSLEVPKKVTRCL